VGEMTQTMYAHMNKIKIKKKETSWDRDEKPLSLGFNETPAGTRVWERRVRSRLTAPLQCP
jgi:hypothetical protein